MTLISEDALHWLVALLRDGRTYYRHAIVHTADAEVRRVFEIAAEARTRLLSDLKTGGHYDPLLFRGETLEGLAEVPLQQRYEPLRRQFDPAHPALQAEALLQRETATLRLMDTVFRSQASLPVRALMKKHFLRMQKGSNTVLRLAQRLEAA